MYKARRKIVALFCLTMIITLLSACEWAEKHEKTYVDTKPLTYLGKYSVSSTVFIGKILSTEYDYHLVFKLVSDTGVATPIRLDITEDMYDETQVLGDSLEAKFYTNGFNDMFILMGDEYFTLEDYFPEQAGENGTIEEYDFVDQLYVPID